MILTGKNRMQLWWYDTDRGKQEGALVVRYLQGKTGGSFDGMILTGEPGELWWYDTHRGKQEGALVV